MRDFALVLPSLATGGAERVMLHLAEGLSAAGQRVHVVALDGRGPLAGRLSSSLIDLGRPHARTAAPRLVRALRRLGPDVVIASQTHLNLLLCLLRPVLPEGARLVLREPGLRGVPGPDRPLRPVQRLQRRLYRAADLVLASSGAMRVELAAVLRERVPVAMLPNPVDVAGLRRRTSGIGPATEPGRHLVVVGRLVAGKAVDDLLWAVARGSAPADRLTIVGDGPEAPALRVLAERLGLEGRVTFTGHLDAPERVIATADVLVMPSRNEGLPNVVLEALALGTPVLATTELPGLVDLTASAPPGAVTLVPRAGLADALRAVARRDPAVVSPSLLPAEHDRDRVVAGLLALVP